MVMLDVWRRGLLGDLSQDEVKLGADTLISLIQCRVVFVGEF